MGIRIAILSDVHLGLAGYFKGIQRKLTEYAEEFIQAFAARVSARDYDFAVNLGDLIEDGDLNLDLSNLKKAVSLFSGCSKPVYHLLGNHDIKRLSMDTALGILGYERSYFSFDHGGYHFVLLFSEVPDQDTQISVISPEQLKWLQHDLNSTPYPAVIFCHHSLADSDLTGNPWFEGRSEACLVKNRLEVREVILASGKVLAVVNGHLHWNRIDMHGRVPFITIQSATENFANDGIPANSWAELEINEREISLTVSGNDFMSYKQPLRPPHRQQP